MTMSTQSSEPSPLAGRRLTRLLAGWADAHRLDAGQVAAIRARVLAEPAPPDFDWWWRLLDPDGGQAFRGLHSAPGWRHVADAAPPVVEPGVWASGMTEASGWAQEDGEFLPYLRLT
jgi:hypothetical protein